MQKRQAFHASPRCLSPFCLNLRFSSGAEFSRELLLLWELENSKSDEAWSSFSNRAGSVVSIGICQRYVLSFSLSLSFFLKKSNYPRRDRKLLIVTHVYLSCSFFFELFFRSFSHPTVPDHILGLPDACFLRYFFQHGNLSAKEN